MTDIVKAGGSSLDSMKKIERIVDQWGMFDKDVVFVASANGKTTDRIKDAIKSAERGEPVDPEAVFADFEGIYQQLPSGSRSHLDSRRTAVYETFRNMPGKMPPRSKRERHRSYTARRHLEGEFLSAALFDSILQESGRDSAFVDLSEGPLTVKGDYHSARIDLETTRVLAARMRKNREKNIIVLPGYGGADIDTSALKTLGRNGSDIAATGYFYAFEASRMWLITDVQGILNVNDRDIGRTVPQIDVDEAKDSAGLGAKLPGRTAVHGIERRFLEDRSAEAYITRWDDIGGPNKTRIVYHEDNRTPVKLVAGRDVILYAIEGDIKGIQNALHESGMEYTAFLHQDYAFLIIPDADSDTRTYLNEVLGNLLDNGKRGYVSRREYKDFSLVGAVGNGMNSLDIPGNGFSSGILSRGSYAISSRGMPIVFGHDIGKVSIGFIIPRNCSRAAQMALYEEFCLGEN